MLQAMHTVFTPMLKKRLQTSLLLSSLVFSATQTNADVVNHKTLDDALQYVDINPPKSIHDTQTLSFPQLMEELADKRLVFVGEIHDRYDHHLNQLAVLQALHKQTPTLAIGVEWFQSPFQMALNRYLNGNITEAEMLQQSGYYERWRYDFRQFRPIFEYAQTNKLPIIALNAPVELTRKVSKGGLESLSATEREQLPHEITPADEDYQQRLKTIFSLHSNDKQQFEHFMQVQRVWDETMAANISQYLNKHLHHRMVVFSGSGHISQGDGIPKDVQRRMPSIKMATLSSTAHKEAKPNGVDYTLLSEPLNLPPTGKMGVLLDTKDNKVVVQAILKESSAQKAGLQAGDQLIMINKTPVKTLADLKGELAQFAPNQKVKVTVQRDKNSSTQNYTLTLQ